MIHPNAFWIVLILFVGYGANAQEAKERLVILADMGNEPDEEQQIAHMLMYANEFDLEGLIAVSGKFLHSGHRLPERRTLYPQLFHQIIDGYAGVYDNLRQHAEGYPPPHSLRSIVAAGHVGYGVAAVGKGKGNEGSRLLIDIFQKEDERPMYVVVNAGSNTLAQALIDFEATHSEEELRTLLDKLIVFENGAQDDAGAWICARYPGIRWMRSNYQTYAYGGPAWGWGNSDTTHRGPYTWAPYEFSATGQHQWALKHIKNHGTLGMVYPMRQTHSGKLVFIEGGGTIPWLGLVHRGLSDITKPSWGGWSGRFSEQPKKNIYSRHESVEADERTYGDFAVFTEASDRWKDAATDSIYDNIYVPVWRWRQAYFDDFQCRMDWCVASYSEANHPPVAAINGDNSEKIHFWSATPGEEISLDGTASSDPDGDALRYHWWVYREPSTYQGDGVRVEGANTATPTIRISESTSGTIHLIFELADTNAIAPLRDYRRLIIQVN